MHEGPLYLTWANPEILRLFKGDSLWVEGGDQHVLVGDFITHTNGGNTKHGYRYNEYYYLDKCYPVGEVGPATQQTLVYTLLEVLI